MKQWKAYFIVGSVGTIIMFPALIALDRPTEPLPVAMLSVIGLLAFMFIMFAGIALRADKAVKERTA